MKENKNTPEFWDQQFQTEYEGMKAEELAKDFYYRWWPQEFHVTASQIPWGSRKILNVGCGLGHFERYIKAMNPNWDVHGTDFSHYAVEKASELAPHIKFFVSGNTEFYANEGTFDVVTALDIIEHVEDDIKFVREMHRLLKDGGKVIFTTPIEMEPGSVQSEDHIREYSMKRLEDLVATYFDEVRVYRTQPYRQLCVGKKAHRS